MIRIAIIKNTIIVATNSICMPIFACCMQDLKFSLNKSILQPPLIAKVLGEFRVAPKRKDSSNIKLPYHPNLDDFMPIMYVGTNSKRYNRKSKTQKYF